VKVSHQSARDVTKNQLQASSSSPLHLLGQHNLTLCLAGFSPAAAAAAAATLSLDVTLNIICLFDMALPKCSLFQCIK
jgi:hypothetical protein